MKENVIIATSNTFQKDVLESPLPVLVDFWAPWCGPCRMVAPVVEELANEYSGKLVVAKLNTDENMEISMKYGIMSIPTLGIFLGGKLVDGVVGAVPKHVLKKKIDENLKAAGASLN